MERLLSLREIRIASRGLFKPDHPRSIDRYIDYFGGPAGDASRLADPCAEGLLDLVAEPQAAAG